MDYVKLWTTFHDDPGIQNLPPKAIVYYVNALSWCGKHETDGVFTCIGRPPREAATLVEAGKFEALPDGRFLVHGWHKRQLSRDDLERRRAAGKKAADARWTATRIRDASTVRNAKVEVEEQAEEQETPSREKPARARDELFDALAEATGRDPRGMTRREQRACGTAIADIRRATPDLTPAEIQRRAELYQQNFPHAALTPSALANQWSACARPAVAPARESRSARLAKEIVG